MPRTNLFAALAAGLCLAATGAANPDIAREGVGTRRAALDKMELTPFDQGLWAGLTDWRIGEAIDAESTRGKVVLVYTFSGYLPTAVRPISIVNRLAAQYGEQGLLVVGVHADEAYEEGVATAEKRRVTFPIARDAGSAFRDAMRVDQDPDFYVIDRAGRLRYADIETASLERAVSALIGESAGDAEGLLDRMASADARAAADARRSARLRSRVDLSKLPWVPFPQPGAEAYDSLEWPKIGNEEDNNNRRRSRNAPSGPVKLELPATLEWRPSSPTNTNGRATLIYLFEADILTDFNQGGDTPAAFFSRMDALQNAHPRDILVIGAMVREESNSRRGRRRGGSNKEEEEKTKKANEAFDVVTKDMPVNHPRVNDYTANTIMGKVPPYIGGTSRSSSNENYPIPYHILVDSSGTVRWHGTVASSDYRESKWEAALNFMLANDPGIRARREAEQAYIKSKTE